MAKKNINYRARRIQRNEKLMTFSLVVSLIITTIGLGFMYYLFFVR